MLQECRDDITTTARPLLFARISSLTGRRLTGI
jgi:hypothetical protein